MNTIVEEPSALFGPVYSHSLVCRRQTVVKWVKFASVVFYQLSNQFLLEPPCNLPDGHKRLLVGIVEDVTDVNLESIYKETAVITPCDWDSSCDPHPQTGSVVSSSDSSSRQCSLLGTPLAVEDGAWVSSNCFPPARLTTDVEVSALFRGFSVDTIRFTDSLLSLNYFG